MTPDSPSDSSNSSVELTVKEAEHADVGRQIARISSDVMDKLDVTT